MSKALFVAEKPSVAIEFAKAMKQKTNKGDGFIESEKAVFTWCVGHLVSMSYPEKYDPALKKWRLESLPFLPKEYKYEVISRVKKQFDTVKKQLHREDIDVIYVCTDSGREGEYIYRLVDEMVGVRNKEKKRVWIDSQTEDEILRGVREAKPLEDYDNLSQSAYLRAKEDYLMGINFSRLLTLKYGPSVSNYLDTNYTVIAVGRVMTCVLGMIVKREREIRGFVKEPFYKINGKFLYDTIQYDGEWKAVEGSKYFNSHLLSRENGFKKEEDAKQLIGDLEDSNDPIKGIIKNINRKKEKKNPPLLYNLAELQNECSKRYKLSPDETLKITQELYEKKLVTYPRTDARVLSTAVAKEISKNIRGLAQYNLLKEDVAFVLDNEKYKNFSKTKYVNDKMITDHYAIIPTGQNIANIHKLSPNGQKVFELISRRFIAVFYDSAVYEKLNIETMIKEEVFFTSFKVCVEEGFLKVLNTTEKEKNDVDLNTYKELKKGTQVNLEQFEIKKGETSPPKRYNSGNIILAMENAGQLIEDDELREQIKGSGIGTSATRSEILKKLIGIHYIDLNKKTQILTPTALGEIIYDIVNHSINSLLNPELTASWEKGLDMVAKGDIDPEEYMKKLEKYISSKINRVITLNNQNTLFTKFEQIPKTSLDKIYKKNKSKQSKTNQEKTNKKGICKCFACNTGEIMENSKAFYCSKWKSGCKISIWKDALKPYGQEVNEALILKLSKEKVIKDIPMVLPQTKEKGVADLELRKDMSGAFELKNFRRNNNQ
ncbi:DNA topoisomerase-3 [Natranaerovirga hydrolytica]|uniref:DNA topoisomerase n=1 Tax=Natranaerovirga hydrolytica TaxID=680378 RepID=A0A4R1N601_9FIRM|nr:DNA topoisomerase [Natranaerovirga hydrolytica]TCK98449.1 DNA topoisomerase-3 [Natranaerovirga hydrolytica]